MENGRSLRCGDGGLAITVPSLSFTCPSKMGFCPVESSVMPMTVDMPSDGTCFIEAGEHQNPLKKRDHKTGTMPIRNMILDEY